MSIAVPIRPDELLPAYVDRLSALNGNCTRKDLIQHVARVRSTRHTGGMTDLLRLLADMNAMTLKEMLGRHTCLALYRCPRPSSSGPQPMRAEQAERSLKSCPMHIHGGQLRMCMDCMKTETEDVGFCHWHRGHQVPGRHCCPIHGVPLLSAKAGPSTTGCPADSLRAARPVLLANAERHARNPYITRTLAILDLILERHLTLDRDRCMRAVQGAISASGADPTRQRWFSGFSAAIDREFSLEWLRFAFPRARFVEGQLRMFAEGWIADRVRTVSHMSLAVTASMLFPTAESAVQAFVHEPGQSGRKPARCQDTARPSA